MNNKNENNVRTTRTMVSDLSAQSIIQNGPKDLKNIPNLRGLNRVRIDDRFKNMDSDNTRAYNALLRYVINHSRKKIAGESLTASGAADTIGRLMNYMIMIFQDHKMAECVMPNGEPLFPEMQQLISDTSLNTPKKYTTRKNLFGRLADIPIPKTVFDIANYVSDIRAIGDIAVIPNELRSVSTLENDFEFIFRSAANLDSYQIFAATTDVDFVYVDKSYLEEININVIKDDEFLRQLLAQSRIGYYSNTYATDQKSIGQWYQSSAMNGPSLVNLPILRHDNGSPADNLIGDWKTPDWDIQAPDSIPVDKISYSVGLMNKFESNEANCSQYYHSMYQLTDGHSAYMYHSVSEMSIMQRLFLGIASNPVSDLFQVNDTTGVALADQNTNAGKYEGVERWQFAQDFGTAGVYINFPYNDVDLTDALWDDLLNFGPMLSTNRTTNGENHGRSNKSKGGFKGKWKSFNSRKFESKDQSFEPDKSGGKPSPRNAEDYSKGAERGKVPSHSTTNKVNKTSSGKPSFNKSVKAKGRK
jgi:hypothetical protein